MGQAQMNKKVEKIIVGILVGSFITCFVLFCFIIATLITTIFLDANEIKMLEDILNALNFKSLVLLWIVICVYFIIFPPKMPKQNSINKGRRN